MSEVTTPKETPMTNTPTAEDILEYLKDNPKFLEKNPTACDFLIPPKAATEK